MEFATEDLKNPNWRQVGIGIACDGSALLENVAMPPLARCNLVGIPQLLLTAQNGEQGSQTGTSLSRKHYDRVSSAMSGAIPGEISTNGLKETGRWAA